MRGWWPLVAICLGLLTMLSAALFLTWRSDEAASIHRHDVDGQVQTACVRSGGQWVAPDLNVRPGYCLPGVR